MPSCLIALGSNVGDRQRTLDEAVARLARRPQVRLAARSPWLETAPVGGPAGQSAYLNGAVLVETSLGPDDLLTALQEIEAALGRQPGERWGPRPADLDLLLFDRVIAAGPRLVLPHPRMAWRRFVLEPAARIAPAMVHPPTGWTVGRLLEHLNASPWYVAVTGSIASGKTRLAEQVADRIRCRLLADPLSTRGPRDTNLAFRSLRFHLESLEGRARPLAAGRPEWQRQDLPTVSDFWLDQSAALARVWLAPEAWEAYRAAWEQARRGVARPRLIVLLEPPGEELLRRIRSRRPDEAAPGLAEIERISRSILDEALRPDQGPLLRLPGDCEMALEEVLAAIQAMQ